MVSAIGDIYSSIRTLHSRTCSWKYTDEGWDPIWGKAVYFYSAFIV